MKKRPPEGGMQACCLLFTPYSTLKNSRQQHKSSLIIISLKNSFDYGGFFKTQSTIVLGLGPSVFGPFLGGSESSVLEDFGVRFNVWPNL